jgi:ADP-ribose pyrophosphatase
MKEGTLMGNMKWTLVDVKQETDHPFLNYFTLTYDVEKEDGHHKYSYYMASRRSKDQLVAVCKVYDKPDGVLIPLYLKDPRNGKLSLVVTSQFRPPLNTYVSSFPAGLIDGNEDIRVAAVREAKEEVGADIDNLEILSPAAPTSSGLSDEMNGVVLAHVSGFEGRNLEEFEDIGFKLVPMAEMEKFEETHFVALQIRMIVKYLLERFKGQY